jgi:uncharacterized protein
MRVTALYAALLAAWFVVLSLRVIRRRGAAKISLGDGGDKIMQRMIRAQANFAEYVPLALLLIALLEWSGVTPYVLNALGATLFVARVLHGYALSFTPQFSFGRVWGTGLTFLVLLAASVMCLYQALRAHWA